MASMATAREAFTDLEWETLQFTPVAAFHAVAHADGWMSRPEADVFMTRVGQVSALDVPQARLLREVFDSLRNDEGRILRRFDDARRGGLTFPAVFRAAKAALDTKAEPAEAAAFRHVIRLLCVAVAEAAPLVGLKVTDQEQEAVEAVTSQLA